MYIANSPLGRLGYNFGMVLVLLNGLSSYFLRQQEAALHFGASVPSFLTFSLLVPDPILRDMDRG